MPSNIGENLPFPMAHWLFDEGQGNTTKESIKGIEDQIQFALSKGRFQPPLNPIWSNGISGKALLFDGYSTYIQRPSSEVTQPVDALTITAWIAPRTYDFGAEQRLSAIVNQHNKEWCQGYIFGLYRHGSWSLQLGLDHEWVEVWSYEHPIPLNQWSFVAATYDKASAMLKLYLNGSEVASHNLSKPASITPFNGDFLIGRNNNGMNLAESFTMNNYNGMMDELVLYNCALSASQISTAYHSYLKPYGGEIPVLPPEDLVQIRQLRADDRHRPQYHLSAPEHWMNEPHGPIYFNGQYHLFYQYNPQGPFWHYIHWGHWVSDDLVHWRDLPPALSPERDIDPDGIWSGSASYDEFGNPVLFYTAGNLAASPNQSVGMARSTYPLDGDNDLKQWVKHPVPIVVQEQGIGLFGEFRDPFVWKEDDQWIMLVGTGAVPEGNGGTAVVYTSGNLMDWDYRGPLYISDYHKYPSLGTAWELPVLLPLKRNNENTGKHIFLICPWGPGAKVEVIYWIGTWDNTNCRFIPDHEEPQLIDVGDFHFTGPSGMVDPRTGRTILFTIAQGERTPEIDYDCGWSHGAGMPVSLTLRDDGRLGVQPIAEINRLRGRQLLSLNNKNMNEVNQLLTDIHGDMLEIMIEFQPITAAKYGISLRRSLEGEEESIIYYDQTEQQLCVNREKTTLDLRERTNGVQRGSLQLNGELLKLHILLDRSLIEAYANGLKSLTTRVYPSRMDANGLKLWSDGEMQILSLEIWEMNSAFQETKLPQN